MHVLPVTGGEKPLFFRQIFLQDRGEHLGSPLQHRKCPGGVRPAPPSCLPSLTPARGGSRRLAFPVHPSMM